MRQTPFPLAGGVQVLSTARMDRAHSDLRDLRAEGAPVPLRLPKGGAVALVARP